MASHVSISLLLFVVISAPLISTARKVGQKTREEMIKPILHSDDKISSIRVDPSKVMQLSQHPRVFLYKAFLSSEECDHLIFKAHSKLEDSKARGNNTDLTTGIFLSRGQDETVTKIEERLAAWTFLPKENGEDMQILRYERNMNKASYNVGEESKLFNGGQRVATVIMFLSDVNHGGETIFPSSKFGDTQVKDNTWSKCAASVFAVKPIKGDALLVFNLRPNVTKDTRSNYAMCTVHEEDKWFATKRIFTRVFNAVIPLKEPSLMSETVSSNECTDEDANCVEWAATGECQKNPVFMLGSTDYYGSCRKSCGVC